MFDFHSGIFFFQELVGAIYGVVVAVGECHAQWLASALAMEETIVSIRHRGLGPGDDEKQVRLKRESTNTAKDLMKLILRCSDAPGNYPTQETHSQLAFGFWYILQVCGFHFYSICIHKFMILKIIEIAQSY